MAKRRVTNRREVCLLVDRLSARYLPPGLHMKPGLHPYLGTSSHSPRSTEGKRWESEQKEDRKESKRGVRLIVLGVAPSRLLYCD